MSVKISLLRAVKYVAAAGGLAVLTVGVSMVLGDDAKPKLTIKEIMKNDNKGEDSIVKQIVSGKGKPEQVTQLQADYKLLAELEPPRGDKEHWKTKVSALIEATDGLKLDDKASIAKFKTAVTCKACHQEFKPPAAPKK